MEVLGASFSNLQLAQQNSSLAQSNMNSSYPNVPPSYAANFFPQPNSLPVQPNQRQAYVPSSGSINPQFSQVPACMCADQPARHSSGKSHVTGCHHHAINLPSTANDADTTYQVLLKGSDVNTIQTTVKPNLEHFLFSTGNAAAVCPGSVPRYPVWGQQEVDPNLAGASGHSGHQPRCPCVTTF